MLVFSRWIRTLLHELGVVDPGVQTETQPPLIQKRLNRYTGS